MKYFFRITFITFVLLSGCSEENIKSSSFEENSPIENESSIAPYFKINGHNVVPTYEEQLHEASSVPEL